MPLKKTHYLPGRAMYNKTIIDLIKAHNNNSFSNYTDGKVTTISLPQWAFNKLDAYAEQETN